MSLRFPFLAPRLARHLDLGTRAALRSRPSVARRRFPEARLAPLPHGLSSYRIAAGAASATSPSPDAAEGTRSYSSSSAGGGGSQAQAGASPSDAAVSGAHAAASAEPVSQDQPRLQLTFTCSVDKCGHRSTHEFAKKSYEMGIVIIQCPGCKNRHLIADHLGWFKDSHEPRTVEQLVEAKGERVRRGKLGKGGTIEYDPE